MDELSIAGLAERVDRLERENLALKRQARWWKRGGLLVVVAGAIGLMVGAVKRADDAEVVVAQAFYLQDKSGKLRASLFVSKDDNTTLVFYDKEGGCPFGMDVTPDGLPAISLRGKGGECRIGMGLTPTGEAGLIFYGEGKDGGDETARIAIGVDSEDMPNIDIFDSKHENLFHAPKP